jgi:hypothetical protein
MKQLQLQFKNPREAQPLPSQWQLLQEFDYDNRTGLLYRKNKKTNIFRPAGTIHNANGYKTHRTDCNGKIRHTSRIIYKMHTGEEPPIVDHIDGNSLNNRLENLRAANYSTNQFNAALRKDNPFGIKNVRWNKRSKKWIVRIYANRKLVVLAYTDDLELAELVAIEGRDKYHGQYARHQ